MKETGITLASCDQNNDPSGIGRIIAEDGKIFIDAYFKNG